MRERLECPSCGRSGKLFRGAAISVRWSTSAQRWVPQDDANYWDLGTRIRCDHCEWEGDIADYKQHFPIRWQPITPPQIEGET